MRHGKELTVSCWRANSEFDVIKEKTSFCCKWAMYARDSHKLYTQTTALPLGPFKNEKSLRVIIRGTVLILTQCQKLGGVHTLYAHYKKVGPDITNWIPVNSEAWRQEK